MPALWQRCREFLAHYLGGLCRRVDEHHIFLLASGLAFAVFTCVIPLVLVLSAALGVVLERPSIAGEIESFIERAIPYEEYAAYVKELVFARVLEFKDYRNLAGAIGIVGLLLASSSLFSSMRTILNSVYQVKAGESILVGKLRDFGLVLMVLVYFLLSTAILPAWEVIDEFADKFELLEGLRFGFIEDLLLGGLSFALIFVTFLIIYTAVPYEKPPRKVVIVSAVSAAILWELAKHLFGFYTTHSITLKRIYGAYTLLIVVAFWIYYTSVVFIVGAEIGQLYRERRAKRAKVGVARGL